MGWEKYSLFDLYLPPAVLFCTTGDRNPQFITTSNLFVVFFLFLQKFFLQGRFIFGPDVRSLALTIFLVVAPVAVFCVFVARKLMDDYSDHWGVSIMAVAVVFTVYVSLFLPYTCALRILFSCLLFNYIVNLLWLNHEKHCFILNLTYIWL